jgi:hypothetical protein
MANIYQNMIDTYTLPITKPGRAVSIAQRELAKQPYVKLTADNTAADEVTDIATHLTTTSGGNYTITVTIGTLGVAFTTANIVYDDTAATMEAAIDTASPATVGDGDISVAEAGSAGLSDGNCSFTCTGNIAEMPVLITVTDADLSGSGAGVGAVTRTTPGRPDRNAYQALYEMNIVIGAGNDAGESPSMTLPTAAVYIGKVNRARLETIWYLTEVISNEEGIDNTRTLVRSLYNLPEALYGPH